jgi:hypothetical protein
MLRKCASYAPMSTTLLTVLFGVSFGVLFGVSYSGCVSHSVLFGTVTYSLHIPALVLPVWREGWDRVLGCYKK